MLSKLIKTIGVIGLVGLIAIGLLSVKTIYNTDTPAETIWNDLKTSHYNIKDVLSHIEKTPRKEKYNLLNNLSDYDPKQEKVYIVFKYKCPDCENMTQYITEHFKTLKTANYDIGFVNAESELGAKLIKDYGLTEVPTLIYVKDATKKDYFVSSLINPDKTINHMLIDKFFKS